MSCIKIWNKDLRNLWTSIRTVVLVESFVSFRPIFFKETRKKHGLPGSRDSPCMHEGRVIWREIREGGIGKGVTGKFSNTEDYKSRTVDARACIAKRHVITLSRFVHPVEGWNSVTSCFHCRQVVENRSLLARTSSSKFNRI